MNYKEYIKKNKINVSKKDIIFELSNLITKVRLHEGISQAELAKRIGTKQPSIARAENGELEPSVSFLEKIARAIGADLILPEFSFVDETKTSNSTILCNSNGIRSPFADIKISNGNKTRTTNDYKINYNI